MTTIKNLERFIHREMGSIKKRIHSVERDVQRIKVQKPTQMTRSQTHREWPRQQQHQHNHREHGTHRLRNPDEELVEHLPLQQSDTMSNFSDETQTVDLSQQLLSVVKTDNNTNLIHWLRESHGYQLLSEVDERLTVSLNYRITQLLNIKTYTNDIRICVAFIFAQIARQICITRG